MYIHNQKTWPNFHWSNDELITLLGEVRNRQGKIVGKMEALGFELREEAILKTMTQDILKSNEIEGEILNPDQVRSSLARRLGMDIAGLVYSERNVEGVVEMMLDATQQFNEPLTIDRLLSWHCSMFPTGRSGMYKIKVGEWRDDIDGKMQVVSGALGKEKVHFEAPTSKRLPHEMNQFIKWFNTKSKTDPILKAGISHLWFVTIHPFDDGNGRIARAVTDMLLAKSDGIPQRYYSMSSQIRIERKQYYSALERTQKGGLEVTPWLHWFLSCLNNALKSSELILEKVIFKHNFWLENNSKIQNERQRLLLNKLLDDFQGKLTSTKWGKIAKCSQDTALRDINDLIAKNILIKEAGGGRSTSYTISNYNCGD